VRIVIALGGNALLRRDDPVTMQVQRRNVRIAAEAIAPLSAGHSTEIVHGNGPQVGLLSLQAEAHKGAEPYPLDVLDAGTQGMIGYLIQQELRSLLPPDSQVVTLLTMVAVDADGPEPTLGKAGYWLMTITALFATAAGATNAGLYPAVGLSERLAETGQFPLLMARKLRGRACNGLLIEAAGCLVLAVVFKLDSIASIGSAVALVIFTLITAAHLRIRAETGASLLMLILAIVAAGAVLVTFVFTTLIHEPASIVMLLAILVLSIGLDYGWKRGHHPSSPVHAQVGH
jgi:hypothetical protein